MIINTHDQLVAAVKAGVIAKEKAVAVCYSPGASRRCEPHKATVYSPFFKTDPKGHWANHGSKAFVGKRAESVPAALAWATKRYRIKEWKGNRWGDKVPAIVQEKFPLPKTP